MPLCDFFNAQLVAVLFIEPLRGERPEHTVLTNRLYDCCHDCSRCMERSLHYSMFSHSETGR